MSGGSMNYIYYQLEEASDLTHDREIRDLLKDLSNLLHDEEWAYSCDYSMDSYYKSLRNFKKKWFEQPRRDRLKKYIDEAIESQRKELYLMTGIEVKENE